MFTSKKMITLIIGITLGFLVTITICFFMIKPYVHTARDIYFQFRLQEQQLTKQQTVIEQLQQDYQQSKQEFSNQLTDRFTTIPEQTTISSDDSATKHSFSRVDQTEETRFPPEKTMASTSIKNELIIKDLRAPIDSYTEEGGQVPTYTPYAYHWKLPQLVQHDYILIDHTNTTGIAEHVLALNIGDPVSINETLYQVHQIQTIYPDQYASDFCDFSYPAFLQTCYTDNANQGMRLVTLKTKEL